MKVIILCPHNAAKSVAAAAYLRREASRFGLDLLVETAGTDPDVAVHPVVRDALEADGFVVEVTPRHVDDTDLSTADLVINIGCDPARLHGARRLDSWTTTDFSVDPVTALAELRAKAAEAARALQAARRSGQPSR